jgi:hypothetical protein
MANEIIIVPYQSAGENGKIFTFGMSSRQLAKADKQVFEIRQDTARGWTLERRGGYSTELLDGKLVAVAFNHDSPHNHIMAGEIDFSTPDAVESLKSQYDHHIYVDGESVLFPALGVLFSVTPFQEGFEPFRPGVFNREIVAFSQDRLAHYQNASRVLSLLPLKGVHIAGGTPLQFGMTRTQVKALWGEEEYLWGNFGSHKHIVEYRNGLKLRYHNISVSEEYHEDMPLYDIQVTERDGWQIEVEGIHVFQDDKLTQMKAKYEHIDSKKQKATVFPSLGIMAVGCGEKKNNAKGAEGKYVCLYHPEAFQLSGRFIDTYE